MLLKLFMIHAMPPSLKVKNKIYDVYDTYEIFDVYNINNIIIIIQIFLTKKL